MVGMFTKMFIIVITSRILCHDLLGLMTVMMTIVKISIV